MREEKICLIDVDWVVLDLEDEWLRRYNRDHDDNLTKDKITRWEIDAFVKPTCGKKIYEYLDQPDLYDNVAVADGAREGIEELRSMGFRCVFASAGMHKGKPRRLLQEGLMKDRKDYIAIEDKGLLMGAYLIDDGFHNIQAFKNGWGILFDAPHNQQYFYPRRAMDWKHVIKIVRQFETIAELFNY